MRFRTKTTWILLGIYAVLFLAFPYATEPIFKAQGDGGFGWILINFYLILPLLGLGFGIADGIIHGWSLLWLIAPIVLFIPHFFIAMHGAEHFTAYLGPLGFFICLYVGFTFVPHLLASLIRQMRRRSPDSPAGDEQNHTFGEDFGADRN